MFKKVDQPLLLALLIPIFAVAPFAQHAGIPNVADGVIHLLRQVDFDRALRDGALVPRWGADLYAGFGYPLYVFAPPLLAYGIELFHVPGLAMDDALKLCVILTLELYSVGMFLFMRPKVGANGALVAAALNVYAPFRLREALVTGGNYPQFLAMALFPLILWAFDGLIRTRARRYLAAASLSYAALILSHLFHALIFTPVVAIYVVLRLLATGASRKAWVLALAAGALALMLAAFFWLPALAERPLTRTAAENYVASSDYHQRFLTPARLLAPPLPLDLAEANADVPLSLGWAQIAAASLGLAIITWRAIRDMRYASLLEPIFLIAVVVVSIFLQLPSAAPIWENVSLLPIAEFPWRFMGVSAFALAALGGYSVLRTPSPQPLSHFGRGARGEGWRALRSTFLIVIAILAAFPYIVSPRGFAPIGTPTAQNVLDYEQSTGAFGLTTINEYLPQTVERLPTDLPAPLSQPKIDLSPSAIVSAQWSPHGENDLTRLDEPTTVRFRIFNYPGWNVSVDGRSVPITTERDGTLSVAIPAGEHRLETRFAQTPTRQVSELISVLALVALGLAVVLRIPSWSRRGLSFRAEEIAAEDDVVHLRWLVVALIALFVLKLGVIDPQGWLRVSRFAQPLTTFDDQVELLGGESDTQTIARGDTLHVRVFWRPTQPLQKDYHVIAQLIATDGRAVTGSDKQHPGDPVTQGETPTSQIPLGKYLRDEHSIVIPPTIEPGRYELRVGLYDPQTKKRLKLPNGETLFAVGTVEIK